jgi:hypothetical protein
MAGGLVVTKSDGLNVEDTNLIPLESMCYIAPHRECRDVVVIRVCDQSWWMKRKGIKRFFIKEPLLNGTTYRKYIQAKHSLASMSSSSPMLQSLVSTHSGVWQNFPKFSCRRLRSPESCDRTRF